MKQFAIAWTLLLLSSSVTAGQEKAAAADSATAAPARPAVAKTDSARPIDALAWLVGGVWTTDASQLGPGMLRIETRYQWADNHAFLRFTTHFVMKDSVIKNYDGNFFWNPTESALSLWYMDASSAITQGSLKMEGDNFQVYFAGNNFQNKPAGLRVTVTRKRADLYTWLLEEKLPDSWHQMAKLDYARQAGE